LEHFEGTIVAAVRSIKMKWEGGGTSYGLTRQESGRSQKKLGKRERKTSQKCIKKLQPSSAWNALRHGANVTRGSHKRAKIR